MGNNDSRAHFRNNIGGLFENDLTGHDASYWLEMIRIPYTLDDIFLAVNSVMIRDLLSKHPENIGELLKVCAETIQKASRGDLTIDRDILLNSVKVVTRFMPVLAENIDIRKVLWESGLAFKIVDGLMGLLFTYNFGIIIGSKLSPYDLDSGRIWKDGILSNNSYKVPMEMTENRIEVLKAILACCSQSLYEDLMINPSFTNPWILLFSAYEIRYSKDTFFSLLNTALNYNYEGYSLFTDESLYETEASLSIQVLNVFLDSKIPEKVEKDEELDWVFENLLKKHNELTDNKNNLKLGNVFMEMLKGIDETEQFEFIISNLIKHFSSVISSLSAYLYGKEIGYYQELIILLWNLIENNSNFEEFLITHKNFLKILDILIVIVANNYENLSKAGIVQLSIFCILHFSSNREFSLQISHKYPNHLPISITGPDYYFDILVSVFHPIILQNSLLSETISTLIIILLNVSPHIKRIGNSASLKLFSIFEHFSLKKNLTKDTKMSQFLYQLLEVFNSRLQYQWDGSSYLIYAIISKKNIVDRLLELKFENLGETDVTEDWFNNFKINLPIGLILGMYNDLLPRIDRIVKKNSQISEAEIIEYLRKITMVGVFPVPHILYLRKFHSTQQTNHWLTSLIWGTIYTRNNNPQLFDSSTIKLFLVSSN